MLLSLFNDPQQLVAFIVAILVALTIHEFFHAWVANMLGDPTAKEHGRLTFNPLAHLDPMGTIFLFLVGFGWGKPVPVDSANLKNEKFDNILISLAGPLGNLITAIIIGLILRFLDVNSNAFNFLIIIAYINLTLMTFNLLPIPPLDGASIVKALLPEDIYHVYERMGIVILFAFVILSNYFPFLTLIINWITGIFVTYIVGK